MLYVLLPDPISVCDPVAFTSAVSPSTSPVMPASALVRALPSYALLPLPVVMVACALLTVSVPSTFFETENFSVTSAPEASFMTHPSLTVLTPVPASVWLPLADASTVNPSGRPSAVTPALVRALPSYVLLPLAAVSMRDFAVTVSLPRTSLTML